MRKVHLYIDGLVLSVGYRSFVKRRADTIGVKGYVRNIEGGVEVIAEGEDDAVNQLIEACRQGPSTAKVTNVTVEEEEPNYLFKDFVIRP
ncbi:acylphosphatase [Candidatus Woesearchaeota archaeon]|nr:acylphosphatase [Candidatus Woesearchaeota archaeon]